MKTKLLKLTLALTALWSAGCDRKATKDTSIANVDEPRPITVRVSDGSAPAKATANGIPSFIKVGETYVFYQGGSLNASSSIRITELGSDGWVKGVHGRPEPDGFDRGEVWCNLKTVGFMQTVHERKTR